MKRRLILILASLLAAVVLLCVWAYQFGYVTAAVSAAPAALSGSALLEQQERGAYLARIGNCQGCHTARGGGAYAGGRLIASEFGQFSAPNITPDLRNGIGSWNAADFWQALHFGKSRDGSLLYPAFPYPNYTQITRSDADALFAYLQTVTAVATPRLPHQLRFPYSERRLLALWRAWYFQAQEFVAEPAATPAFNRGAYLVNGLGHCSACHSPRNSLGANRGTADFSGAEMPVSRWYAPSLFDPAQAHLGVLTQAEAMLMLQTGIGKASVMSGPMSEVLIESLQYLNDADRSAMLSYLQALPRSEVHVPDLLERALARPPLAPTRLTLIMQQGEKLYTDHCLDCHGASGGGVAGIYPALAGNRALQSAHIGNPVRIILNGGFAPLTVGNPRPYSMPPFGPQLSDADIAALLSYVRGSWGNQGGPVSASEVNPYRTAPAD